MAEVNVELGLTTKFFKTWELFGGYKNLPGTEKGDERKDKHLFILKQNKGEGKKEETLNCGDFIKGLIGEISKLTKKEPGVSNTEDEQLQQKVKDLPEGVYGFLESFEVYVEEVYLQVEITVPMKKIKNKFEKSDDPPPETKFEYAFWVGIKMTDDANKAIAIANVNKTPYRLTQASFDAMKKIEDLTAKFEGDNGKKNLENLEMMIGELYAGKDAFEKKLKEKEILKDSENEDTLKKIMDKVSEYPLPDVFKFFQLKDLYFKIWKTDRPEILKEMQLDVFESFKLPPP